MLNINLSYDYQYFCHFNKRDKMTGYCRCFSKVFSISTMVGFTLIIFPSGLIRNLAGIELTLYFWAKGDKSTTLLREIMWLGQYKLSFLTPIEVLLKLFLSRLQFFLQLRVYLSERFHSILQSYLYPHHNAY